MVKKIDISEINISLLRFIRLGIKKFRLIFFFSLLGLAVAFPSLSLLDQGTYLASGLIGHNSNSNAVVLNTIVESVTSTEVTERVASQLGDEGILSNDSKIIEAKTIRDNLNASKVPNSLSILITFTYPDETLSITILNKIIDESISYANSTFSIMNNGVILGEYAVSSTFIGPSLIFYLAIFTSLGLLIGLVIGILSHALIGTIFSTKDLKEFGIDSFSLILKIRKKITISSILNFLGFDRKNSFELEQTKLILQGLVASSSFTTIQNDLESMRTKPEEPLTTLMVSPMPLSSLVMVAFAYARQSSTQGRKTILIDFDLKNVPFTKYLETYQIETKKKASSKEGVSFLSLEENLDLYLPLQDIIPAKFIRDEDTKDIITQVKKKYNHIIIIGPSLLADNSNIAILNYVNSALVVVKASTSTRMQVINSVNLLIDNQLTTVETLVVEEKIITEFPSFKVIQSWFKFKGNKKSTPPFLPKSTKKK
jgi:hypothetical protein